MSESLASLRQGDSKAFFTFDEEPNKDITCAICFEPWQHPVELLPCGHIFCESCLPSTVERCPMCRSTTSTKTMPNRALTNLVAGLPVSCTRCEWQGEYSQFQLHDCPAGNEHRLPRHEPRNMTSRRGSPSSTVAVNGGEERPLLNGDENEGQDDEQLRTRRKICQIFGVLFVVVMLILIPVLVFKKQPSDHDHDSPSPTPAPSGRNDLICDASACRMDMDNPNCNKATAPHPASMFECSKGNVVYNRCQPSTYFDPPCRARICNKITCTRNWKVCPAAACKHFKELPLCTSKKPYRCYSGKMKGTCSDAPDINYCDAICDISTC